MLNFTVDGTQVYNVVNSIITMCKPEVVNFNIHPTYGIKIEASNKGWALSFKIGTSNEDVPERLSKKDRKKAESLEPIHLGVEAEVLRSISKARKEITFSIESKQAGIGFESVSKDGRRKYSGHIPIMESKKVNMPNTSKVNDELNLTEDIQNVLTESINRVALVDVFTKDDLNLWVRSDKKGLHLACFDSSHAAILNFPDTTTHTETNMCVPLSVFKAINKLATESSYSLKFTDTYVIGESSTFVIAIPSVQTDSTKIGLDMYLKRARQLKEDVSPEVNFTCETDYMSEALVNMKALNGKGVNVQFSLVKDKLQLSMASQKGALTEQLETDSLQTNVSKLSVSMNPTLFEDCLTSSGKQDELEVNVSDKEGLIWFNVQEEKYSAIYICGTC